MKLCQKKKTFTEQKRMVYKEKEKFTKRKNFTEKKNSRRKNRVKKLTKIEIRMVRQTSSQRNVQISNAIFIWIKRKKWKLFWNTESIEPNTLNRNKTMQLIEFTVNVRLSDCIDHFILLKLPIDDSQIDNAVRRIMFGW